VGRIAKTTSPEKREGEVGGLNYSEQLEVGMLSSNSGVKGRGLNTRSALRILKDEKT